MSARHHYQSATVTARLWERGYPDSGGPACRPKTGQTVQALGAEFQKEAEDREAHRDAIHFNARTHVHATRLEVSPSTSPAVFEKWLGGVQGVRDKLPPFPLRALGVSAT